MSKYYTYSFTSPEGIYAIIREELKSYLDTGSIDELLWPYYVNYCLTRLGKGSYSIAHTILYMENGEARLPDNFDTVREAWLCVDIDSDPVRTGSSMYTQAMSIDTIMITPPSVGGTPCQSGNCPDERCPECMPELIQAVYKTNKEFVVSYKKKYLLKPGNISVSDKCSYDCLNYGASGPDSFDIRNNKFVTSFSGGSVYLVFYAIDSDEKGNQMVPDNVYIKDYIEHYIKYKMFETLANQVNDETFNQIHQKMQYYKQLSDERFIIAETETKRPTVYKTFDRIKRTKNRLSQYRVPDWRFLTRG